MCVFSFLPARGHGERKMAEELTKTSNPQDIKAIGESVQPSDSWKKKNVALMKELMVVKFQIPELREELLSTYPHTLHHNVASRLWGTGPKYDGQNITGKLLMEIRKDLRTQQTETSDANTPAVTVHPKQPSTQNVLMVADSQLRGFQPDRIKGVRFTLQEAKSMEEVSQELLNKTNLPPTIGLHLLTKSLMKDSVSKVTSDIRALTKNISQRHGTRVLVSLGLPVNDYNLNKKNQGSKRIT